MKETLKQYPSGLKVIVCSFNPDRDVRTRSSWPDHNQDIGDWESHKKMFELLVDFERKYDAGVPIDTLIVCNGDCGGFFNGLDGTSTKSGKFIIRERENIGGSFGGYSYAYENFNYDTYLFTEDDLVVFGDQYYKKILDKMESEGADFVALLGFSDGVRFPLHAHGGIGLVTRKCLDDIAQKGQLPHWKEDWHKYSVIMHGEIPFTNEMYKIGKKMIYYGKNGFHEENLLLPYYNLCS